MLGIKPPIMGLGAQDPNYCTDRTAPLPSPSPTHLPPPHTCTHTVHAHTYTHTCTHTRAHTHVHAHIATHMEFYHVDVKATSTEAVNYVV